MNPTSDSTPEQTRVTLGYIALTDAAPLIVAKLLGFFTKEGLDVTLVKEHSWATVRDKTAAGVLDGSQMLATMPLAMSAGVTGMRCDVVVPMSLDLNGNAITVSNDLFALIRRYASETLLKRPFSAMGVRRVVAARRAEGKPPLTFGIVFPYSTHHYEIRHWLSAAGVDPDRDVKLVVIPPAQMVRSLAEGAIDGCCVGEPWNSLAVQRGLGRVMITKHELWQNSPEKVIAFTKTWADAHPATVLAVLRALIQSARWLDESANRVQAAHWLAGREFLDIPIEAILPSLTGEFRYATNESPVSIPDFHVFFRYAATFPWVSHAEQLLEQMKRWRHLSPQEDIHQLARAVYQPKIYRAAAEQLGLGVPLADEKADGTHEGPWMLAGSDGPIEMGADMFLGAATSI